MEDREMNATEAEQVATNDEPVTVTERDIANEAVELPADNDVTQVQQPNDVVILRVKRGPGYEWRPHEDITAYELAMNLKQVLYWCIHEELDPMLLEGMPENCSRHWKKKAVATETGGGNEADVSTNSLTEEPTSA